jgi:hypothetical protein
MPHHTHILTYLVCTFLITVSVLSGCVELKTGYIPPEQLPQGWIEATSLHNTGIEFLGLEKWATVTYEYIGNNNAFLTITTINTLVLTDESELSAFVNTTIISTFSKKTNLSEIERGTRELITNHSTQYIIYTGYNSSINQSMRIIGEVWNCGISGISLLCIGFISDIDGIFDLKDSTVWATVVGDLRGTIDNHINFKGMIFNVKCH